MLPALEPGRCRRATRRSGHRVAKSRVDLVHRVLVVVVGVLGALPDAERPLEAGLDLGRDDRERVDEPCAVDADRDPRLPLRNLVLEVGELVPLLAVERLRALGALAVQEPPFGLRGVARQERLDLGVDAVEIDPPRVAVDDA
jgi:hypothetical protein